MNLASDKRLTANSCQEMDILYAGAHLSGSNAAKTSLVVLKGQPMLKPLRVARVYEKIGSRGGLFSDERLVEILGQSGPYAKVFIDCPLTVPPCAACVRPVCPGAVQCDDISVAYMLAVNNRIRRQGARKARPINPQSQRLWDIMHLANHHGEERQEPSYSANMAPLVVRARTLQRRLHALGQGIELKETSVHLSLAKIARLLRMNPNIARRYRSFEDGVDIRMEVMEKMIGRGWIEGLMHKSSYDYITRSVENFNAFISAWVAAMDAFGLTEDAPKGFEHGEGWVYLPSVDVALPVTDPLD